MLQETSFVLKKKKIVTKTMQKKSANKYIHNNQEFKFQIIIKMVPKEKLKPGY